MPIYIIKDENGNEVNRIIAEKEHVAKNYDFYELYTEEMQKLDDALDWRNSELYRTDTLTLLPDYPQAEALLVYRQALRDWTGTEDFPEIRPEMAVEPTDE